MGSAGIVLLLHSHMPYVRRNVDWPVGEQWLLESWVESYLPIWELIEDLSDGVPRGRLALTMTPVLAEQLQDAYLQGRLAAYLENRIRQARGEADRLRGMGDDARAGLALYFDAVLRRLLSTYEERFRGRMMEVLRQGMERGTVEVLASAATHAHLPSLASDSCRRAQIGIGLDSYRRCFGMEPRGFWLPECSYTPALDPVLSGFSPPLEYVILDHSALDGARGETGTWRPRRLGSTPLAALLRDRTAHELVWTPQGYPSGGDYREYVKRDHEGHGFQYWRITSGDTLLDEKDIYLPEAAAARARADARDFSSYLERRKKEVEAAMDEASPAVILAAYDTELLGHWWLEGTTWLREVLELAGKDTVLPSHLAEQAGTAHLPTLSPTRTAWNVDGTFSTWTGPGTAGIWEKTHRAEDELLRHIEQASPQPETQRAMAQAAREVLLMESSDWTFMITRDEAADYARDRFESHLGRFAAVMGMLGRGRVDPVELSSLEETDNLFSWLTPDYWVPGTVI